MTQQQQSREFDISDILDPTYKYIKFQKAKMTTISFIDTNS